MMLEKVKALLGITGDFQNELLQAYIDEVEEYMKDAGVDERHLTPRIAGGVVARGVADLWNPVSGEASFSPYFIQRVTQLAYKEAADG